MKLNGSNDKIVDPVVSVILPLHNDVRNIEGAMRSIFCQTYQNWELIVVDDHSTDGGYEVALRLACENPQVTVIKNVGRGLPSALNYGIQHATGEFIARMDSDDICLRNRLKTQLDAFNDNPSLTILGSSAFVVDTSTSVKSFHVTFKGRLLKFLWPYECGVVHPSVMFRASLINDVGGYSLCYSSAQDYELWSRALASGLSIENVITPLVVLRRSPKSNSRKDKDQHRIRVSKIKTTYYSKDCNKYLAQKLRGLVARGARFICRITLTHILYSRSQELQSALGQILLSAQESNMDSLER